MLGLNKRRDLRGRRYLPYEKEFYVSLLAESDSCRDEHAPVYDCYRVQ